MKRWLVVLLVLLALVLLVSPGIVGRLAEKNIEENIAWTEQESPGVSITTEAFQRGWFTSEGRHRVVLEGGRFREASATYAAATGNPELPSLIVDTRLDHGLLPISSLTRDAGSLVPGLANMVSTFKIDPGNGAPVEIPGSLRSKVGLTGGSDSLLLLDPGSFEHGGASVEWRGAEISFSTDPSSRSKAVDGTLKSIRVSSVGFNAGLGTLAVSAEQKMTVYGLNVGTADITLSDLTVGDSADIVSIASVSIKGDSGLEGERFSANTTFSIEKMALPVAGVVDVAMRLSLNGFDAKSLGVIAKAFEEAQNADSPETAMAELYPAIEGDLQTLLSRGLKFSLDQFDVLLPQGRVTSKIALDVAQTDASADFSWPAVLLGMTASVDLRIPAELFDLATTMNPQAGALLAMGILVADGDDYIMEAEYAQGLINVNGAPMPVPFPGL